VSAEKSSHDPLATHRGILDDICFSHIYLHSLSYGKANQLGLATKICKRNREALCVAVIFNSSQFASLCSTFRENKLMAYIVLCGI